MAGLVAGDVVRCTIKSILFEQVCLNTLHLRVTTPGAGVPSISADLDALGNHMGIAANSWYDTVKDAAPSDTNFQEIITQRITPIRSVQRKVDVTGDVGGRGGALTPNTSAFVGTSTDEAGRSQQGGIHMPGVATADVAGGVLDLALVTLLIAVGSKMQTPVTVALYGTVFTPVIFHGKDTIPNSTIITGSSVNPNARTMRRRTVGLGI